MKILIGTLGTLAVSIAGLELGAYLVNEIKNVPNARPFLARPDAPNCEHDGIDSLFGYAPGACETPDDMFLWEGLAFYRDEFTNDTTPTVMVLGGSTTDAIAMTSRDDIGFDTWPRYLARLCQQGRPGCRVVNGGRAAFASSQELLVLARDGLSLKPNVVVSLNGINEYYALKDGVFRRHPFVTRYQRELMQTFCSGPDLGRWIARSGYLPNTMALVKATQYKMAAFMSSRVPPVTQSPATQEPATVNSEACKVVLGLSQENADADPTQVWLTNVKAMQAISKSMGAEYYVFLQPTLGVGAYEPTDPSDIALLAESQGVNGAYGNYQDVIKGLYVHLRAACNELDFCFDLTDLFVGQTSIYSDPRHPNRRGNELQAQAIWPKVEAALAPAPAAAPAL